MWGNPSCTPGGGAPHTTIRLLHQGRSYKLSTINEQGEPHSHYKYLGVYFFTDYAPTIMLAHYLAVVDAFFAALPDMAFSPKEATRLVNTQLIPKLAFRMTAHGLDQEKTIVIQNRIWAHYTRITRLPRNTPPKARFAPTQNGALGLFHLPTRIAALTLTQYQRILNSEAPPRCNPSFFML